MCAPSPPACQVEVDHHRNIPNNNMSDKVSISPSKSRRQLVSDGCSSSLLLLPLHFFYPTTSLQGESRRRRRRRRWCGDGDGQCRNKKNKKKPRIQFWSRNQQRTEEQAKIRVSLREGCLGREDAERYKRDEIIKCMLIELRGGGERFRQCGSCRRHNGKYIFCP